jgi:hypothetical protein
MCTIKLVKSVIFFKDFKNRLKSADCTVCDFMNTSRILWYDYYFFPYILKKESRFQLQVFIN